MRSIVRLISQECFRGEKESHFQKITSFELQDSKVTIFEYPLHKNRFCVFFYARKIIQLETVIAC